MRVWICAWILALPLITPQLCAQSAASLPRTADGKLDLNGIWQAMNTADWDLADAQSGGQHSLFHPAVPMVAGLHGCCHHYFSRYEQPQAKTICHRLRAES